MILAVRDISSQDDGALRHIHFIYGRTCSTQASSKIPPHFDQVMSFALFVLTNHSSGPLNYGHVGASLSHVTMDDSTHSVYLASPVYQWWAYDGKTKDGGKCTGTSEA